MNPKQYDIIGDIHGRFDKLAPLLRTLGYHHDGVSFRNSNPDRLAIFLGDLIDPKNEMVRNGTREVLHTVRDMVRAGAALCILGNHEFNFIAYHTLSKEGIPLRPNNEKNSQMHAGTHAAFTKHPTELEDTFLPWLRSLPFFLDLPNFRVVHACWHHGALQYLKDQSLSDLEFCQKASTPGNKAYEAVQIVLKGIELPLPTGTDFRDHTGITRHTFRARWWENHPTGKSCRDLCFPRKNSIPDLPVGSGAPQLPGYPEHAKPLFFGHYYKPAHSSRQPELANLYCLDFSAAVSGPLASYHWPSDHSSISSKNLSLSDLSTGHAAIPALS